MWSRVAVLLVGLTASCQAGLLGAGSGDGSCLAAPFRNLDVQWLGGCPKYLDAECCSEFGYCRPKSEWISGVFRDCNGVSNGNLLAEEALKAEAGAAAVGDISASGILVMPAGASTADVIPYPAVVNAAPPLPVVQAAAPAVAVAAAPAVTVAAAPAAAPAVDIATAPAAAYAPVPAVAYGAAPGASFGYAAAPGATFGYAAAPGGSYSTVSAGAYGAIQAGAYGAIQAGAYGAIPAGAYAAAPAATYAAAPAAAFAAGVPAYSPASGTGYGVLPASTGYIVSGEY